MSELVSLMLAASNLVGSVAEVATREPTLITTWELVESEIRPDIWALSRKKVVTWYTYITAVEDSTFSKVKSVRETVYIVENPTKCAF